MKSDSSLVRTDGVVELNSVAGVDSDFAAVVYPRNTEHDLAVRLGDTLEDSFLLV